MGTPHTDTQTQLTNILCVISASNKRRALRNLGGGNNVHISARPTLYR